MNIGKIRMTFAVALVLTLTATGLWAAGDSDGSTAAAADKKYVTDPTTGKVVVAPEYGGTLTFARRDDWDHTDTYYHHWPADVVTGVLEKLGIADWATPRDVFDFSTTYLPSQLLIPHLAESWDVSPDGRTYTFNIRKGVRWHDKPPMNGRELTASDVEYNYHRMTGMGSGFDEPSAYSAGQPLVTAPYESITATDEHTLVVKLTRPDPDFLGAFTTQNVMFIYPPEVIKEHGDVKDWRNLVGTGPFEITDWVEGSSITWTKNPNYWGYDEKYPENRLPYIDGMKMLVIPDVATRVAALRSGRIDVMAMFSGYSQLADVDQLESLLRTNPEIEEFPGAFRSTTSWLVNTQLPPFDDVRVRRALQMALNLDEINQTYFRGRSDVTPMSRLGKNILGFVTPFEEWPEEIKQYYRYDPAGAEALLDAAGHPRDADGIRFKTVLEIRQYDDPAFNELAMSYWNKIGIDVELNAMDHAAALAKIREGKGAGIFAWQSGVEWSVMAIIGDFIPGQLWNMPNVDDPVYSAMVEEVRAATTIEERMVLIKGIDRYFAETHWHIWGTRMPFFNLKQPWVIGFNGELDLGSQDRHPIAARLWIDFELKKAMGY